MPSENFDEWDNLRDKIIGLGDKSIKKSYYPELQQQLSELERFKILLNHTNDVIFLIKLPLGIIADLNHTAYAQLNYSSIEILKKPILELIDTQDHDLIIGIFSETNENKNKQWTLETNFIEKNGSSIPMEVNISLVNFNHDKYAVMVARDITERKIVENNLKESLKEKEVLLQEIHHRVKNNLQIVSSLLNLQSKNVPDGSNQEIFKESQDRIKSMALIHEQLYQSKDLAHINFSTYINKMMVYLFHSYSMNKNINLNLDLEDIKLEIETAIPCGLIINELVSNSLKHAFKGRDTGEIFIIFKYTENGLQLKVADDGVGFPDSKMYNSSSLGLKLVNMLVEQIDGNLEISHEIGTKFTITFKEMLYKSRL